MKKIVATLFFLGIISLSPAQNYTYADSLKKELAYHPDEKILLSLSYFYLEINLDSSMKYTQQAYQLGIKNQSERLEAWSLSLIGAILWRGGNTDQALSALLKSLKMFETLNDSLGLSITYISLGSLYFGQNDLDGALNYFFKAVNTTPVKPIATDLIRLKPDFQRSLAFGLIGNIYINLHKLDSALYYTQKSYEIYMRFEEKKYLPITLNLLGYIHQLSGNSNLALDYYKLSVKESFANGNLTQATNGYITISFLFKEAQAKDSAYYYAKKAFSIAKQINNPYLTVASSTLLKDYYKQGNMLDSAFRYQEIVTTAKDSLLSLEKIRQVQNLSFNEQVRQQEIAAQKILQAENRKKNLQLMGISIFILVFSGVILLLGRKKVKSRTVEFLALLALLLLFEFISLFLHPYIADWTHETPVLMLLILAGIAAILVPTHHKLEKWIKGKLTRKLLPNQQPVTNLIQTPLAEKLNPAGPKKDPY